MTSYHKKMFSIEVTADAESDYIWITDPTDVGDGPSSICVHIDQVGFLIQWIEEAKKEILARKGN